MSGLFIQHQVAVVPTLQLDATGPGIRNDLVYLWFRLTKHTLTDSKKKHHIKKKGSTNYDIFFKWIGKLEKT